MTSLKLSSSFYTYAGTSAFVAPLCQAYEKGTASLSKTSGICSRFLKEKFGPPARIIIDEVAEAEHLLHLRELCVLGIEAKTSYYENTGWGKIANFFQNKLSFFFGFLGYKTPIKAAEEVRDQIDTLFMGLFADALLESKATDIEACAYLARYLSTVKGKTIYFPAVGKNSNPDQIVIAKPNGDVYSFSRQEKDRLGFGNSRAVYKGYFCPYKGSPKEVAIVTSFPINGINRNNSSQISKCTQQMKQEQANLAPFKNVNGIIKIQDHFSISIQGAEVGFTVTDLYKHGNLESFLNSTDGKSLSDLEKLDLMESLEKITKEIHQKNKIHRAIQEKNILIDFDPTTRKVKPILMNFESCIDVRDDKEKQEILSAVRYWSPEYLEAYLRGQNCPHMSQQEKDKLTKANIFFATSPAMDVWNLGLIFYRIRYGTNFSEKIDPEFNRKCKSEQIEELSKIYRANNFDAFKKHPVDAMIRSKLNVDPEKRTFLRVNV